METVKFVLIIHQVSDYNKWKIIFDKASFIRKKAGELSYNVLKYQDNPNKIVHLSIWSSHENAKLFFQSPALVKIRKEAGVKQPKFIYLEQLDSGLL